MSDEFAELFAGTDVPRELPADLRDELLATRADLDAVAATEAAAQSRPLPTDLRHRLLAAGTTEPLPGVTRRRLLQRLGATGGALPGARWTQAAAVVVVVLVVAGGLAVAFQRDPDGQSLDLVAPPTTTTTTVATTTTEPAPVVAAAPETTTTTARPPRPSPPPPPRESLVAASTCDDLLAQYRTKASELIATGTASSAYGISRATPAPAAAATSSGASFSQTNVHEPGVDEPDTVKTDDRRVFALDRQQDGTHVVRALVIGAEGVVLASSTPLPQTPRSLLLSGDRLLVIGRDAAREQRPDPPPGSRYFEGPTGTSRWTTLWTFDVADPTAPRLIHTRSVEGTFVDARFSAAVARVVIQTDAKGPAYEYPNDDTEGEKQRAAEENTRRVAQSTLDDWLPRMVSEDRRGPEPAVTEGRVCDCNDSMRPAEFAGFSHLSVLTIDPAAPETADATSIQGGASTVYASSTGLFATTTAWIAGQPKFGAAVRETFIHRFALGGSTPARYDASGSVPGYALNQFSMSEYAGHFRIATTVEGGESSESLVTVLRKDGSRLVPVGQVGGLGKGERIYAVRFIGDTGYVVTFRQVDPLYVVDLRDPTAPKVTGELKITGYSAYLHPTDPGRLLGVGQEASEEGRPLGTQVSLFDVSDPAAPQRADQEALGTGSSSTAEFDHHAFLWWARTRTLAIPVVEYDRNLDDGDQSAASALVLKAGADTLDVHGRISHAGHVESWNEGIIERTFVIRSSLYTLSNAGLLVSDIETLAERQWVALA